MIEEKTRDNKLYNNMI